MTTMRATVMHVLVPDQGRTHCGRVPARLLVTTEEGYDQEVAARQRICTHCERAFRYSLGARGFLFVTRFANREPNLPEVIWVQDEPIVGPFCKHCGNPDYMHGPGGRCRSGRIHALLPPGDLPRAGGGFEGVHHGVGS